MANSNSTCGEQTLVCGLQIQIDHSGGQGHCWRNIDAGDIGASDLQEIEGEIIDGNNEDCDDFVTSSGTHYRW